METDFTLKIGLEVVGLDTPREFPLVKRDRSMIFGVRNQDQILLTLMEYFVIHSKYFHKALLVCAGQTIRHPNGTLTGMTKHLNYSQIDVGFPIRVMREETAELVDFTYPFKFQSLTFMTPKAHYKPQIWNIFHTVSSPVWMAALVSFVVLFLFCCAFFRPKHPIDKILLHLLAVFLRQNSILNPSSVSRKFLVYSWVVGAMFLCLAYDSVFLSFLSFPPVHNVRNMADLVKCVEKRECRCLSDSGSPLLYHIAKSKEKNLHVIVKNLWRTDPESNVKYFVSEGRRQNLAYFTDVDRTAAFASNFFVSEDHFSECVGAIMVRKDFPFKVQLEKFVHRMMASGLYFRYLGNDNFFDRLVLTSIFTETEESTNRKLTLTDVAPAFVFLITGYIVSILVFIGELLLKCKTKSNLKKENEKRKQQKFFRKVSV